MQHRLPLSLALVVFSSALVLISISSITVGPMNIGFSESISSLLFRSETVAPHINMVIHEIRFPRTLLCMLVGAILALCGAVMQGLFRNPLAEPGIIGVSAGAALGAASAIVGFGYVSHLLPEIIGRIAVPLFAFIGGTMTTFMVYRMGTGKMGTSVTVMLLAGVAFTALSAAGIGYLSFVADDQMLRDITLWSMGSLAGADVNALLMCAITLLVLLTIFCRKSMALNALLLGESEANHLGIPVEKLKKQLILLTAAGVGITVSICGVIGFIGLVIPHLGRMICGPDHRSLLPISALLGALLLTGADMVARIAVAPAELPVGIVTALIGAPFFLYLLYQQRGRIL